MDDQRTDEQKQEDAFWEKANEAFESHIDAPYVPDVCYDNTHHWPVGHSSGDTCQCGAFYIEADGSGAVKIQGYEDNGDDPRE